MATQKPFNEKGLINHGPNKLGKQGVPSQEAGLGAFRKGWLRLSRCQELGMVCGTELCKDTGVSIPGLKPVGCWVPPAPALSCTRGWQGWGNNLTGG